MKYAQQLRNTIKSQWFILLSIIREPQHFMSCNNVVLSDLTFYLPESGVNKAMSSRPRTSRSRGFKVPNLRGCMATRQCMYTFINFSWFLQKRQGTKAWAYLQVINTLTDIQTYFWWSVWVAADASMAPECNQQGSLRLSCSLAFLQNA